MPAGMVYLPNSIIQAVKLLAYSFRASSVSPIAKSKYLNINSMATLLTILNQSQKPRYFCPGAARKPHCQSMMLVKAIRAANSTFQKP